MNPEYVEKLTRMAEMFNRVNEDAVQRAEQAEAENRALQERLEAVTAERDAARAALALPYPTQETDPPANSAERALEGYDGPIDTGPLEKLIEDIRAAQETDPRIKQLQDRIDNARDSRPRGGVEAESDVAVAYREVGDAFGLSLTPAQIERLVGEGISPHDFRRFLDMRLLHGYVGGDL